MTPKIIVTPLQRANALKALELWAQVPPKQVVPRLHYWRCSTAACFGGHLATWEHFRKQGVWAESDGSPQLDGARYSSDVSKTLFGHSELFYSRRATALDTASFATDHELVTHRLRWLIENSEVQE